MQHSRVPVSIPTVRSELNGRVIAPEDAGYDEARVMFMGGRDPRPPVIVRPADAADVARVIAIARESGLPLAVRSGGHSGAFHSTTDDGIVLDLRDMKTLEINPSERTAWAETGLSAAEYSTATGVSGLATGFGDTGSVGIGGITLSGGIGYLTRKHGLTIDSVLAAKLVTANGEQLQVDATSHPDLFWAIRGGGGNFGVVTHFKYQLHPVSQIVGGMMLLPASADVIVGVIDAAEAAPEELSVIANVMPAPPLPFVPATYHGQLVVMLLICYAGDAEAGARAVAPFRALAEPIADMVRPMRYPEMFPPDDPSYHPKAVARTMFMEKVDRPLAETILDYLRRSDASLRVTQLRVLGGAMARVPSDATAFAHRNVRIMANVAAFYEGPHDRPIREAWVTELSRALHQDLDGAYVGFLADDGEARIQNAYPGSTWDRLKAIKARYDPANFFRLNHNVTPEKAGV